MNGDFYKLIHKLDSLTEDKVTEKKEESKTKSVLKESAKPLAEKYMGWKKTVASIKKGGSAENPEAVAAAIGRKKYGKEKFQKAAAAGRKLGEQQGDPELHGDDYYLDLIDMMIQNNRRNMRPNRKQKVIDAVRKQIESEGGEFVPEKFEWAYEMAVADSQDMFEQKSIMEMDKSQKPPGRDGGDEDAGKKQIHLGPEHIMKSKDFAKDAKKVLDKAVKKSRGVKESQQGVAEGYSLKKTSVSKHMEPGDPDEYIPDVNIKDTDYEIINNKTGQVVGAASWTTNDFMGPGALKITMRNGATRYLDIWASEKGNPQTAFNRFVKDPKTAKKYKEQGVAEGEGKTQKYEMMMRNGQVKRFTAKDDADAKRIAAGHGAKSVIRMKGNVPGDKIAEQGVAEGLDTNTFNDFHKWKEAVYALNADITQMGKAGQYTAIGSDGVIGKFDGRTNQGYINGQQGVAEASLYEGSEERRQNQLKLQIADYEQRAKKTKDDIKRHHYEQKAKELRGQLKSSDHPTNEEMTSTVMVDPKQVAGTAIKPPTLQPQLNLGNDQDKETQPMVKPGTPVTGTPQQMSEVAPPGAKAERMVKHIKTGYAKDGKLTPKEKSIAYATAWKAHNRGAVEEADEKMDTSAYFVVHKDSTAQRRPDMYPTIERARAAAAQHTWNTEIRKGSPNGPVVTESRTFRNDFFKTYNKHHTINKLIAEAFGDTNAADLTLEEKDLKAFIGDKFYSELQMVMQGEADMSEDLKDMLFDYYEQRGELPPEIVHDEEHVERWLKDKVSNVLSVNKKEEQPEQPAQAMQPTVQESADGRKVKGRAYGGSAQVDDEDEDDEDSDKPKKSKEPEQKRGRGRPRKDTNPTGKDGKEKYGAASALQSMIVGNVPKKGSKEVNKLPTTKHKIKG